MTPFMNLFGQFKMTFDHLNALSDDEHHALTQALQGSDWTKDVSGSYLSPVLPLERPPDQIGREVCELPFQWPDSGTRTLALGVAQPQLLVLDAQSTVQTGDLMMRLVAVVADDQGDPLLMYPNVPKPVAVAVQAQGKRSLATAAYTTARAYRAMPLETRLQVIETRLVAGRSKKVLARVTAIQTWEVHLGRRGNVAEVSVQRRAVSLGGGKGHQPQSLTGPHLLRAVLHTLRPELDKPFALVEGVPPESPGEIQRQLLTRHLQPPEPPAPPKKPAPAALPLQPASLQSAPPESVSASASVSAALPAAAGKALDEVGGEDAVPVTDLPHTTELFATDLPSTGVQLEAGEVAEVVHQHNSQYSREPEIAAKAEPQAAVSAAPPAAVAKIDIDPWQHLEQRVAVDPEVLRIARASLLRHRPVLLTGAPGVGKTLLATQLAEVLCGPGNYTVVTADARWTSNDVLGGMRVTPGEGLRYSFMPGIVARAVQKHQQSLATTGRPHALVIDEFNRAHQDEAFGALLTLLDPEYRQLSPLVSTEDGAPENIYLPDDFLLLGTMNDADVSRLHELGQALQRRFTLLKVEIPAQERAFLERQFPGQQAELERLYQFVGQPVMGQVGPGTLRASFPVGTHFMTEVLKFMPNLTLDEALWVGIAPYLGQLAREPLAQLAALASQLQLPELAQHLSRAAQQAPF